MKVLATGHGRQSVEFEGVAAGFQPSGASRDARSFEILCDHLSCGVVKRRRLQCRGLADRTAACGIADPDAQRVANSYGFAGANALVNAFGRHCTNENTRHSGSDELSQCDSKSNVDPDVDSESEPDSDTIADGGVVGDAQADAQPNGHFTSASANRVTVADASLHPDADAISEIHRNTNAEPEPDAHRRRRRSNSVADAEP